MNNSSEKIYDLIVVGGGAAGIFCALQCLELRPDFSVLVLEKSNKLLSKVKISGGGRCNVTHACFDPMEMIENYPRGSKELLGPFHKFMCGDMMAWLEDHGVETKIEDDGRVFPVSDSSQSIIDCFLNNYRAKKGELLKQVAIDRIEKKNELWELRSSGESFSTHRVLIATGSSKAFWKTLESMGHKMVEAVPSLFTFNIKERLLQDLPGLSVPNGSVNIPQLKMSCDGPILITHWGLSGPGILKLSAFAARELAFIDYSFNIEVNWSRHSLEKLEELLLEKRKNSAKKIVNDSFVELPKRLWHRMIETLNLENKNYQDLSKQEIEKLIEIIGKCPLRVKGKSTYKDEFVTAGGIECSEIDFRSMESKILPGIYFAGEVLNIDGVTGGFNFQACWTEAFIAAKSICSN